VALVVRGDFDLKLNLLAGFHFGDRTTEMAQHFCIATCSHGQIHGSQALWAPAVERVSMRATPKRWEVQVGMAIGLSR
jgi:hypothetical protein